MQDLLVEESRRRKSEEQQRRVAATRVAAPAPHEEFDDNASVASEPVTEAAPEMDHDDLMAQFFAEIEGIEGMDERDEQGAAEAADSPEEQEEGRFGEGETAEADSPEEQEALSTLEDAVEEQEADAVAGEHVASVDAVDEGVEEKGATDEKPEASTVSGNMRETKQDHAASGNDDTASGNMGEQQDMLVPDAGTTKEEVNEGEEDVPMEDVDSEGAGGGPLALAGSSAEDEEIPAAPSSVEEGGAPPEATLSANLVDLEAEVADENVVGEPSGLESGDNFGFEDYDSDEEDVAGEAAGDGKNQQ